MKIAAAAAAFWTAMYTFHSFAGELRDCSAKELASIDMNQQADGQVVVPLTIGGKTRTFILDISSASSGITQALATELNLEEHPFPGRTQLEMFGSTMKSYVVGKDIEIGNATTPSHALFVIPSMSRYGDDIDGFLGLDLLKQYDVEFDFRAQKMKLFSQDHCSGSVVYWANTYSVVPFGMMTMGFPTIGARLDGAWVGVSLSSDPGEGVMNLTNATRKFGIDLNSEGLKPAPRQTPR